MIFNGNSSNVINWGRGDIRWTSNWLKRFQNQCNRKTWATLLSALRSADGRIWRSSRRLRGAGCAVHVVQVAWWPSSGSTHCRLVRASVPILQMHWLQIHWADSLREQYQVVESITTYLSSRTRYKNYIEQRNIGEIVSFDVEDHVEIVQKDLVIGYDKCGHYVSVWHDLCSIW